MNIRERIETVFAGGKPDAMVWFGDMTYWHASHEQTGDIPEKWRGSEGRSRMHQELGLGEYVPGCCAFTMKEGDEVRVTSTTDRGIRVREWQTPVGALAERWEYCPDSFSWGHLEFPVKEVHDLEVVRFIFRHRAYQPCHDVVRKLDKDMGTHGLPVVATHPTPMADLYKTWVGIMNLSYMLIDAEDEIRETCQVMNEAQTPMWSITAESPCNYVMLCENFTAESMGGLFDDHFRDILTEKTALLHNHGKKVLCHIDGTLRGLAEKLPEVGIDCLDAVTPAPVGDVPVCELRKLVGPDALILGGLPGAMFAPPFGRDDMEKHVMEIIRCHKDSGKFMFGVADQVPPNGDIELVRLITELVEKHGRN
ncbi:MAG: hypothetical protein JW808_05965 [Victivallales bacterium]|nr:hypothetical protein [Victivallales bacterium]